MDPLVDKIMVAAAFISLVPLRAIPAWAATVVAYCSVCRNNRGTVTHPHGPRRAPLPPHGPRDG